MLYSFIYTDTVNKFDTEISIRPLVILFCFKNIQTSSEVHPASYSVGTGGFFSGVKRLVRDANHYPLPSVEVTYEWAYIFIPTVSLHGL
jgi:hypothetical protein